MKVTVRRKLKLVLKDNKDAIIVENENRKKEEEFFSTGNVTSKRLLLVESTSEVVGAVGLQ